jgi:hypothetical protein
MTWSEGSGLNTPLVKNALAGSMLHHHAASNPNAARSFWIARSRYANESSPA